MRPHAESITRSVVRNSSRLTLRKTRFFSDINNAVFVRPPAFFQEESDESTHDNRLLF